MAAGMVKAAKGPSRRALRLTAAVLLVTSMCWRTAKLLYTSPQARPPRGWEPPRLCKEGEGSPLKGVEAACPLLYERQTVADIAAGSIPYLFGGPQRPCCRQCLNEKRDGGGHSWPKFCRFESNGPLCPAWTRTALLQSYLKRNFEGPLTLSPCDFWPYIRGRTLWFFGDSQSLDFYKAMMCFLYEFWDGTQTNSGVKDLKVLAVMDQVLPSTCVQLPQGSRICYVRTDTGHDLVNQLLPVVPKFASVKDIAVINFGLHHRDKTWRASGYPIVVWKFCKYVSKHRAVLPTLFWQQTPPQHFQDWQGSGEYIGGHPPYECVPMDYHLKDNGELAMNPGRKRDTGQVLKGGWRNARADKLIQRAGLPIVESWNESVPLWTMHRDNGEGHECTHNCHPGAAQTWVYNLHRAMKRHGQSLLTH